MIRLLAIELTPVQHRHCDPAGSDYL